MTEAVFKVDMKGMQQGRTWNESTDRYTMLMPRDPD